MREEKPESTFTVIDPRAVLRCVVSLKDIRVLGYVRDGAVQAMMIEQSISEVACPACGGPARVKDRPRVMLVDLPVYGRPMHLIWRKHRFTCPNPSCGQKSWTSTDKRIASSPPNR